MGESVPGRTARGHGHPECLLRIDVLGDIRVAEDTIIVTYYDAPNVEQLRDHYENLPEKLLAQNVNPRIPWLYDFKLDFRFR